MSTIAVSESQWPNYRYSGATARVRIYYSQNFRSSENINIEGSAVGGNGWFLDLPCTVDGSRILHVPAFTLYSTEDSNNPASRFSAVVYSLDGARRETIMGAASGWVVPASPTSTTVALLEIAQGRGIVNPPLQYITRTATQALIDAAIGLLRFATTVIAGWVKLSVPAVDVSNPIAAGDNDHRMVRTVYNADAYPYYATGNGSTNDSAAIQAALTAAGITGGVVVLPSPSYNLGSTGLTVPSNVVLMAPAYRDTPNLLYSGSGVAVNTAGAFYVGLVNLYVRMSNAVATGFRWGDSLTVQSQWCWAENLTAHGTNNSANTGTGFDFRATGGVGVFSGQFYGKSLYSLGNKYGITVESTGGNESWTGISLDRVTLIGRTDIVGSVGIKTDVNSNLEGSVINGLFIESFVDLFDWGNASGAYGFTILNMGNELNTNAASFPFSWSGSVYDPHNDGYYQRSASNGLANLWDRERRLSGEWITESINRRLHILYDGSSNDVQWGVQRGASVIGGELARDKFIVSTSTAANSSYVRNWWKLLEFKTAYNNAVPTEGSWGVGSQIPNSAPAVGLPTGWVCTASGTFKTALVGITGGITINTRTLTVNSISTLVVGDYISIVGVTGTKLIVDVNGTTITIDSDASATVVAAAVQYVTPTFQANDNLGTARGSRVTSQFDATNTTTLANITGLSVMLEAGFTYTFTARLYTSSNIAGGVKCAIAGTCTASSFISVAQVFDADAVYGPTRTATKGNTVGNKTAVTAADIEITGTIQTSTAGTLTVQFAQNAGNLTASSVLINSTLETQLIG